MTPDQLAFNSTLICTPAEVLKWVLSGLGYFTVYERILVLVIIKSPGLQTFINCVGGRGVCFCSAPVESCRHLIEDFFFQSTP